MENDVKYYKKLNNKYKNIIIILSSIIGVGILCVIFGLVLYFGRHSNIIRYIYNTIREVKISFVSDVLDRKSDREEFVHNARNKLDIVSPYGDNQGTHPKVLYFKDGFNGYKYYMVYTPYPFGDDYRENPTIMVSNDMINWKKPEGIKNPIVSSPSNFETKKIYNSDGHLVYNYKDNTLECFYRYVNDYNDEVIIYRVKSSDGINWSDSEEVIRNKRSKHDYVSPAIIYEDGKYKIWYVYKKTIYYTESEDLVNFSKDVRLKINYNDKSLKTWHIDVIKSDLGYEVIMVAYSNPSSRETMSLYYTYSKNNKDFIEAKPIIKPSNVSWDNKGLYRSSFIKDDNGVYYVFYSGISEYDTRGIGLSYGNDIYNLRGLYNN